MLDSQGRTVWSSSFDDPAQYAKYNGVNVSDRPYFAEVAASKKPYFTPVDKSPFDNQQRMFISYPIFEESGSGVKNKVFSGTVVGAIRLEQLNKLVTTQLSQGFQSSLGIVDSRGSIVYSESPELIGENFFGEKIQSLFKPAFENEEKLAAFNQFMGQSIEGNEQNSQDFIGKTGETATISASPILIRESTSGQVPFANPSDARAHHLATLYILTPHNVSQKVGPLIAAQQGYSIAIIIVIGIAAIMVSYLLLASNRRLEKKIQERTESLKDANDSLREANSKLANRTEELAAANEQLKVHDRLQRDFINIAAHELRTPITPIVVGLYLAKQEKNAEGKMQTILEDDQAEMIHRNAKRLEKLANDILAITRIEGRGLELAKEPVNVNETVANATADAKTFVPPR